VEREGKKFLRTEINSDAPGVIVHSCKWGVYHGRLDYFHGKYIHAMTKKSLPRLARSTNLPLDLVPTVESGNVKITVLFEGKPLTETRVWTWSADGKSKQQITDASGTITMETSVPGIYSASTIHILPKPTGEFQGKPYDGVMHGTTCSFHWPLEESEKSRPEN
jgi:hypothetical protein